MKIKTTTECEKFKQECIELLEEQRFIEESARLIAEAAKREELTKLAEEKFKGEFPLAEFKNGEVHLCGEKFKVANPEKVEPFFTIYSDSGWAVYPIRNKIDYAEYLKLKENRSKDGWNLFMAILYTFGITTLSGVIACLIAYILVYYCGF